MLISLAPYCPGVYNEVRLPTTLQSTVAAFVESSNADIKAFETLRKGSVATLSTELHGCRGLLYEAFGFHLPGFPRHFVLVVLRKLSYTAIRLQDHYAVSSPRLSTRGTILVVEGRCNRCT